MDPGWGLDEQLGLLEPLMAERVDQPGNAAVALDFIMGVLAGCDVPEVGNQGVAVCQTARADALSGAVGHKLLGAAAANLQQALDCRAVMKVRVRGSNSAYISLILLIPAPFTSITTITLR